jgi:hypothetical protein
MDGLVLRGAYDVQHRNCGGVVSESKLARVDFVRQLIRENPRRLGGGARIIGRALMFMEASIANERDEVAVSVCSAWAISKA